MIIGIFRKDQAGPGEEIYRKSFFNTSAGLCLLTHPDFEIYDLNDSFARIFGSERAELRGSLFSAVWKKCDERDSFFTDIIREGRSVPKATGILRPDNSVLNVTISGTMLSKVMILITVE